MLIKPKLTGRADFLSVYNHAIENYITLSRKDPKRLYHLRCSQLPFCPSSTLISWGRRGMVQQMDLLMAYYVSVGTAVHTVMQTYLAQSGRFVADYKCGECGTSYPLSQVHECCGFPTEYEEVSIDYKTIQGHIDGIYVDKNTDKWIVDYKTTSLDSSGKKLKNPGLGYELQVKAYAYLLWKQYGIKVKGVMLVFIPRDNPKKPVIWELVMQERDWKFAADMLKRNRALHSKTLNASTLDQMKKLMAHKCGSEWCEQCRVPMAKKLEVVSKYLKAGKYPIRKE